MIHCVRRLPVVALTVLGAAACGGEAAPEASNATAFVGATVIDGTGAAPIENATILVRDGRIEAVGSSESVQVPEGAARVDLTGRTVIPGLINAHGHVGDVRGLETGQYSRENVLDQLGLYARYGVTTVVSLGDDQEAGVAIRDEQNQPGLNRARLFVAGPVLTPQTPEEAVQQVNGIAEMGANWAKIRIDDALGTAAEMPPEVYRTVIETAHGHGIPVAVHIYQLEDAKAAVTAGADFVAHSVRDVPVDQEFISLLLERDICVSPTLTREVSTFAYGDRPDFFDDPFFLKEADSEVVAQLLEPERQASVRESAAARYWEEHLPIAMQNLKTLSDAGVRIAMGTDTGPPGRFQGYFEHLEMEMMADAGLTPMQVLVASTGGAAGCVGLDQDLGTIEAGKYADFVVLEQNPLDDIRNTRTIESVWINGNRVPGTGSE